MVVYIDSAYKCHVKPDGIMREIETDFFNGKCQTFIEGYRFVPIGETWIREAGIELQGAIITPWKPYAELEKAQAKYEHEQLSVVTTDRDNLLDDIAALIEEVYAMDSELME